MPDTMKTSRGTSRRSTAKGGRIRIKVDDLMDAARWIVGIPVLTSATPSAVAQAMSQMADTEEEKALWLAVKAYVGDYVCITDDVQADYLKTAWQKTPSVTWPLPKRLETLSMPDPLPSQ